MITIAAYSSDLPEWNRQAAEFLNLSPSDQKPYVAAVNAVCDPSILLKVLSNDGILEEIVASGTDITIVRTALSTGVFDLAPEAVVSRSSGN